MNPATLKGFIPRRTLSGFKEYIGWLFPGFSLRSNPGLKLGNACGVNNNFEEEV